MIWGWVLSKAVELSRLCIGSSGLISSVRDGVWSCVLREMVIFNARVFHVYLAYNLIYIFPDVCCDVDVYLLFGGDVRRGGFRYMFCMVLAHSVSVGAWVFGG